MRVYQESWSIETAGWSIDQSSECLTLCPADVEASLQISCFRKRSGEVTCEELRTFAEQRLPPGTSKSEGERGAFVSVHGEYEEDDVYWRNWWLANGRTHLFITFNCDKNYKDYHIYVVDWMLSTLDVVET